MDRKRKEDQLREDAKVAMMISGYTHVVAVAVLTFTANTMIMAAVEVIVSVIYSAVQAKTAADEREKIEKLKKKRNLKGLMKVRLSWR